MQIIQSNVLAILRAYIWSCTYALVLALAGGPKVLASQVWRELVNGDGAGKRTLSCGRCCGSHVLASDSRRQLRKYH